ncbi:MAG TPA: hypothetical protein IAA66_03765 [Candidatus Avichristensenella intestinipullorum]|uniref:UDP-N-acetylglucosamine diphosphorylase n=1 Tax=Candidatus Avichristensenella intestinipullorum TaxID=2840693 RepID=A0A9D1CJI8_9FIRM|nr:hypothetical protein [Candidatus Avichristensenella intestinipullorum]
MKHTALIQTTERASGAHIAAPFLLSAVRKTAAACCDEVTVLPEDAPYPEEEGDILLLLDANMPLVTQSDLRALLDAVEDGASAAAAPGGMPRCIRRTAAGTDVRVVPLPETSLLRVDSPATLAQALAALRERTNRALMEAGVCLIDPAHTYIDADVTVGAGTVIYPNCTLTGGTVIGEGCTLLPNCRIDASRVGAGTRVESSVLLSCEVGANATVGPFAYIRPQTRVGDGCRVGDFVELKNATIGEGTKISHLTYVGDSDLGRDINLGCGVVFVNYDGKEKHRTTVDDKAFIGCNVNLVSPVHVGREAYIAAGSTVTEDVPGGALAIARQRQTVRPGWVDKRKEEGKL